MGLFGCTKGAMFKALSVEGSVKGNTRVGGIIANAIDTKVDNCNNYCNLNSKLCIGGIVAKFEAINKDVSISNCQNYGDIFSSGVKLIGGIVGYCDNKKNEVKFEYCTNYGNISQKIKKVQIIKWLEFVDLLEKTLCFTAVQIVEKLMQWALHMG